MLIDDYLEYQSKYEKKYGKNTIILMQVGGFFEAYAIDNEKEKCNIDTLTTISHICDMQISRKSKKIIDNSRKNPLMAGFPLNAIDKYIQILINNNYTVVLIEQVSLPPEPERKVTGIYSPGTIIDKIKDNDSNYLMSIYLETIKPFKYNNEKLSSGISIIDLSTGKNIVFETYSSDNDTEYALDEIYRTIQIYNPSEIIISYKNLRMTETELKTYLEIENKFCHFISGVPYELDKLAYQTNFLKQIFPNTGMLNPIEYIDLDRHPFGLLSYIILLDFAYGHNETIINKIEKPEIWDNSKFLVLTTNSIKQLDVISNDDNINKMSSLFGIINNTSTPLGKRLLKNRLLNPIKCPIELNKRYTLIEELLAHTESAHTESAHTESAHTESTHTESAHTKLTHTIYHYKNIENILYHISDIERMHRKMSISILEPYKFAKLDTAYTHILELLHYAKTHLCIDDILPEKTDVSKFTKFIEDYRNDINIDEIMKYSLNNITGTFFNKGVEPEIDNIQNEIDNCFNFFNDLRKKLSSWIVSNSDVIKLEKNDKEGYFFLLTKKRSELLKESIKNVGPNYKIKVRFDSKIIKIPITEFSFNNNKSACKIKSNTINLYSNKIIQLTEKMKFVVREEYIKRLHKYENLYMSSLKQISKFVSVIDVIKSCAKTSVINGYSRPKIVSNDDKSYIEAKEIRHPIIEKIQTEIEYVSNNITIGKDNSDGILLYGTNASGKSSLMKAIGLNIIMAQAGMFVAADSFEYHPYDYLFTRIRNNDNLFKGHSSFAVEMQELRNILTRTNNKSLILGDELCSGTESCSAVAIFATSVHRFATVQSSFIFATHLHKLCNVELITSLKNIKIYHLKVIFDKVSKKLIYDRKLEPGNGPALYGLEVCKAMGLDSKFIELANQVRKELLDISSCILPNHTSKYNSNIYVNNCQICGNKGIDVHHIKFQCTADLNEMIGKIHKNIESNLVVLCKKCHIDVHNHKIKISEYKQTSNGVELSYKFVNKSELIIEQKKRRKFSDSDIIIINQIKDSYPKITRKEACYMLNKKHNIEISPSTLSKIWNNTY